MAMIRIIVMITQNEVNFVFHMCLSLFPFTFLVFRSTQPSSTEFGKQTNEIDSKLQMKMFSFGGERKAPTSVDKKIVSKKKAALKVCFQTLRM